MTERESLISARPIALQEGWQNGPASIELDVDELNLDDGVGAGIIFKISTPTDPSDGMRIELGTGSLDMPAGQGRLEFWLAASLAQARDLRDALTEIIDANGMVAP